jgi:integrase
MAEEKKRFAFTKRGIAALRVPKGSRRYCYDTKTEGLAICVSPSGVRTFYLYKWLNAKPVRIPLGKWPTLSVQNARDACLKLLGMHANGVDIHAARHAVRHEQTVGGLLGFWIERAKGHKKTWKDDQTLYDRFLAPWATRRLSSIKKADVAALHAKIGTQNGHYQANRVLSLVSAMFGVAGDIGFVGVNPARGVKKFREVKRDRFLTAEELPKFFESLLKEPSPLFRDFFVLAILTGARRSNMEAMAWQDIDLDNAYWRIPESKSGLPVVVALVPGAVAILTARKEATNGSPWVFPAKSRTGHLSEPTAAWRRLLKRAGLANLRIHDLRRSLGSWQAMGGASLSVIGKSLGHTQIATTEVYARLALGVVRTSVESATTAMLAAGKASVGSAGVVLDVSSTEVAADAE